MQFITTIDEKGNDQLKSTVYLDFYYDNIQPFTIINKGQNTEQRIDIANPSDFFVSYFKDDENNARVYQNNLVQKLLKDDYLTELQDRLLEKGIQCCMLNMFYLCLYLAHLAKNRIFILLSPTPKDTLNELKDVSEIKFYNKDSSSASSRSDVLIEGLLTELKAKAKEKDDTYVVQDVITWDKLANKEIIEAVFVNELSEFLSHYFQIKRKKGSVITTTEQELVCYFLYAMELAPSKVTKNRYRQLMSIYKEINFDTDFIQLPLSNGKYKLVEASFLKYDLWKSGKIDFKNPSFKTSELKNEDKIKLSKSINIGL